MTSRRFVALLSVVLTVAALGCGSASSSPTTPSSAFTGTWSGTFGTGAGVPMTVTLTQSGSSVTGLTVITCSGCGDRRSNVAGTVSANVATVTLTNPGESTPFLRGVTFTMNGTTITTRWLATDGTTITGTLTPSAAPSAATITSTPNSVSMTAPAGTCSSSNGCTVFQNISINSSTAWTSTVPGFGSLGEGFNVSPTTGPAGLTNVVVTYRWTIPTPSNGFFRFRTTTSGVYVELPVIVNVK